MTPEYPIEISEGVRVVLISQIIQGNILDCQMLRAGIQCNNTSSHGMIVPNGERTIIIPICDMCIDDIAEPGSSRFRSIH